MLGGSFWIALLRNSMGAGLMMGVFLLLDRPGPSMRRKAAGYMIFGLLAGIAFSFWYVYDYENYVRFAGMLSIPAIGIFCIKMSPDTIYTGLYKLALGFYLLSITVFCGIDISRVCFGGSIFADILIRIGIAAVMLFLLAFRVRRNFLDGIEYLSGEMDWFSAVTVVLSILIAALIAFWPGTHELSAIRMIRTAILFFMSGVIQYLVYQLYFHKGRERRCQIEKELLETNERLIRHQLELMKESSQELDRIRHDARHHCLFIEEYARNNEKEELLAYVRQYRQELEQHKTQGALSYAHGCGTIHNILSVYARRAEQEGIQVTMHVKAAGEIAVEDIDLVAIIANIFENAIHGCAASGRKEKKIHISVMRKGCKIVIQCCNTCAADVKLKHGLPESGKGSGTGIFSVLKTAAFYNGEAEFAVENGMFAARVLLNAGKGCVRVS